MQIFVLTLFLFLSSCSLFKASPSLTSMDKEKLLDSVKVTGEGKGRLSLGNNQYVFGVDSVLQKTDWILAVSIPLHGEEVMILKNLKQKVVQDEETESFEERIRMEFKARGLHKKISSQKFMNELRSLIRFMLAKDLNLERRCNAHKDETSCLMDGEKFSLTSTEKKFFIRKVMSEGHKLEMVAQNLTDSFFSKTDIHLYTEDSKSSSSPAFSMELFW